MISLLAILLAAYSLFILFTVYHFVGSARPQAIVEKSIPLTVLIAYRNEENNLPNLLKAIESQEYPAEHLKVILVNDHSEDQSFQLVKDFVASADRVNWMNIQLTETYGKKAALELGLNSVHGEILVLTDADCLPGPNWLRSIVHEFAAQPTDLLLGGIITETGVSIVDAFQTLETHVLFGISKATCNAGIPQLSNGGNIAISSSLLNDFREILADKRFPGGDDMFLLRKAMMNKRIIRFNASRSGVVKTQNAANLKEMMLQRRRWITKMSANFDFSALVPGLILSVNLNMLMLLIWSAFNPALVEFMSSFWLIKCSIDLLLIFLVLKYTGNTRLIIWGPLLCLLYPLYLASTVAFAFAGTVHWKNRRYTT